jgi:hypothetical protein
VRIGDVLGLTVACAEGRRLILLTPKSGYLEVAFMPARVAERLRQYVAASRCGPEDRIFRLSYSGARALITSLPHDVGGRPPMDIRTI